MIEKYVAINSHLKSIKCVEVEKETAASVWINGRRHSKRSSYENHFDTWQEAHDFLRESAEKNLSKAHIILEQARSKLEFVKRLKPIT